MFDTKAEFTIPVPGLKRGRSVTLKHFPTDEQQIQRAEQDFLILGRGAPTRSDSGEFDQRTIAELATDPTEATLSPAEATAVMEWLFEVYSAEDPELSGDDVVVVLELPSDERVTHTLTQPTYDQIRKWSTDRQKSKKAGGRTVKGFLDLEVSVDYYDGLNGRAEGYGDSSVPAIHKEAVLAAIKDYIDEVYAERPN